jgi:hypothetical protein
MRYNNLCEQKVSAKTSASRHQSQQSQIPWGGGGGEGGGEGRLKCTCISRKLGQAIPELMALDDMNFYKYVGAIPCYFRSLLNDLQIILLLYAFKFTVGA